MAPKKLTLYTNHRCPWAHRAHIALAEIGLEFEEVIIDLNKPREPWYLKEVNPRGLVPALKYGDEVIIESGVVTQFLADAFPSHLLPNSGTPEAALQRARIHFFVDTFSSKVPSQALAISLADSEEERNEKTKTFIATIRDEIAPLLADAAPFFGGSKKPTLAEVNAGSFVLRYYGLGKKEYGLYPEWMVDELRGIEVWQRWVDEVVKLESVTGIWNEKEVAELTKKKLASLKAQRAK